MRAGKPRPPLSFLRMAVTTGTRRTLFLLAAFCSLAGVCPRVAAQIWRPMGPPGGDVISLVSAPSEPARLYLGTLDGHIFGSMDDGRHWELLGRPGSRPDLVVQSLSVDPNDALILYAGGWTLDPRAGGGLFRSVDGGRTWQPDGLQGHAVRAVAVAPSDSAVRCHAGGCTPRTAGRYPSRRRHARQTGRRRGENR